MIYVPKKRKEKKKVGRTREGVVNSRCDHFFFFFNGVHTISVICVRCIFKSAVISEKDVLRFRREKKMVPRAKIDFAALVLVQESSYIFAM